MGGEHRIISTIGSVLFLALLVVSISLYSSWEECEFGDAFMSVQGNLIGCEVKDYDGVVYYVDSVPKDNKWDIGVVSALLPFVLFVVYMYVAYERGI